MEKVTKSVRLSTLAQKYGHHDFVSVAENMFGELKKYGIITPATFSVSGSRFVSSVEWIYGDNLWESKATYEFVRQSKRLYLGIAQYLVTKWLHGGWFLADINSGAQYVYGTKDGDRAPRIYLVDTDLFLGSNRAGLCIVLEWFVRHMRGMEIQCNVDFDRARAVLACVEKVRQLNSVRALLSRQPFGELHNSAIPKFRTR